MCVNFSSMCGSVGMECEDDALELLVLFSQGSPLMMQHIGDAVFWQTDGEIITEKLQQLEF